MKKIILLVIFPVLITSVTAQQLAYFNFSSLPYLQNMTENGVTVFWEVNKPCTSYILYGETKELGQKALSIHNGQVDANLPVQKIRLKNLTPGKTYYYKVVSKEIRNFNQYWLRYGDSISSSVHSFTLPSKNIQKFSFLAFNDTHDHVEFQDTVIRNNPDFDFAFYNGDYLNNIYSKEQILSVLCNPSAKEFAGNKPFFYCRGNHETRGVESRLLSSYIETPNNNYYYTFVWGNTCFVVLDTGEDKPDNNNAYYGLAAYDQYRSEQAEWLKSVINTKEWKNARNRIVCAHIPISLEKRNVEFEDYVINQLAEKIAPMLQTAKVDLLFCGHTHNAQIRRPDKNHNYPIIVGGGPITDQRFAGTTYIKTKVDEGNIKVELYKKNGDLIDQYSIQK